MDPEVTLYNCDQAISDLRLTDARELLTNYREWRRTGGFQPFCLWVDEWGDKFGHECSRRLLDAERQAAE
jgi:hypothetical protein